MAETINTAFSVGDTVFYVNRSTFAVASSEVEQITVDVIGSTIIKYLVNSSLNDWRLESQVFADQGALAASYEPL